MTPLTRKNGMLIIDGSKREGLLSPQMKEYKKEPIPVTCLRQKAEFPVTVSWQDEPLVGKAGDWLVTDGASRWPVADDLFKATYQHVHGDIYVKVATIQAMQINEPFLVETLEGEAHGKAGDYLAQGAGGEAWPIPQAEFQANYMLV